MISPLPNSKERLLELALTYQSKEEFKKCNLPKYLLAKKLLVLPIAFPTTKLLQAPIRGIFKLYKGNKVVYIGHSTIDMLVTIKELDETMDFDTYTTYSLASDSDITTLSLYLANYYRPRYNTNIGKNKLSYTIETAPLLGVATKGELK